MLYAPAIMRKHLLCTIERLLSADLNLSLATAGYPMARQAVRPAEPWDTSRLIFMSTAAEFVMAVPLFLILS